MTEKKKNAKTLEQHRAELVESQEQMKRNINASQGAIQLLDMLIAERDEDAKKEV